MAAKLRILAMTQDAVMAGLLPKQPLETRLAAVVETATSTYLGALDARAEQSLWEEEQFQLPQHPNIPAAPPTV